VITTSKWKALVFIAITSIVFNMPMNEASSSVLGVRVEITRGLEFDGQLS